MPGYSKPPKHVLDVMQASSPALPSVAPGSQHLLLIHWTDYPAIDRLSRPYLRLGGLRIEPQNHGRRDTPAGYGIKPTAHAYTLIRLTDDKEIQITGISGPQALSEPYWSSDGKYFAFRNSTEETVELWIGEAETGEVKKVDGIHVNATLDDDIVWLQGSRLIVKTVSSELKVPTPAPTSATGPVMQESLGGKGQSSTYEVRDTLNSIHDEELFDFYLASQLVIVDASSHKIDAIGPVGRYFEVEVAPDNVHILVSSIHHPYSYITTFGRFPRRMEVWKLHDFTLEKTFVVAELALADRVPVHGVRSGPRDFFWRQNAPCELFYIEALDGGNWKTQVEHRDKIMSLASPFDSPKEVIRLEQRFNGIVWGQEPDLALVKDFDRNRLWRRGFFINVDEPSSRKMLYDMSAHEKYDNPGAPYTKRLPNGSRVIRQEGDFIFLSGDGASPQGDRPFLDRLNIKTIEKRRLFRSSKDAYERFLAFGPGCDFLTWRQTPSDHPNVYRRHIEGEVQADSGEAVYESKSAVVTQMQDPAPIVRQIKKRLVSFKREDGLALSFKLLTPPGYQGGKLPTILRAYPLDYADAASAGQTSGTDMNFVRLRQYLFLLLAGYAIIDEVSFPIIGDPKCVYDTYLEQLVANAKAAVEEAVRIGVADPDKIGVCGHSHGAFMTANLCIHSDLFKAGVATSGAYNKIITSFGFQNERRSLWEAPEMYAKVSPFHHADKLKAPLLVVHGLDDANPGTTPLQSKLFYEALRGNGAVARLVMLPHEPHWYAAQETNEHFVHEMIEWFDRYVKGG
ncbi:Alpha/Beta hydrolase protein [Kockovaella imperatae]|uniref:Dipeptidyl-peptidase V n=1 Tax=Kockovaella imperatae TaxID=4999 RepID=A0A1Y1UJC9_9TREE|nr:Alpha/Beta hydrolase protein [Kockovaella imperatae]ORX38158.1 Alpha/Beta hydrolase protein [Kockovaella imperatae]